MAQTRRKLAGSAALLALAGYAVSAAEPTPQVKMTPIMAAGARLKQLSALEERDLTADEADAVTQEQCGLQDLITDTAPQTIADAVVLLMVATSEIAADWLYCDGTFGHERADIIVRRVMHFLAGETGVGLADLGGTFFLPSEEHEAAALTETVAEAAARFYDVDPARAQERQKDRDDLFRMHHLRSQNTPEQQRRLTEIVAEASKKWANLSDDDPQFDAGRAMLERSGVTLPRRV